MKGKLSRMWRSGLSMMLALIMMFSLGTVAFATEGSANETAKDVAEDVTVIAKNLVKIFADNADVEKAEAIAKYVYASFEEQGYIALVVEALEASYDALVGAMAEVEYVVANLSPELKAELKEKLANAEEAVANLIDAAKKAKDLGTDLGKAELKVAYDLAIEKLYDAKVVVEDIINAATAEDAAVIRASLLKVVDACIDTAFKLGDLLLSAIADSTTATISVPCAGYNVVALGDDSVNGYAPLVAKALGANLNDDVANADLVLVGYGFDGITDYVASRLTTANPEAIDWSSVLDKVLEGTDTITPAVDAIKEKLVAAGLTNEIINLTLVALESYAYGYAKYLLDYPLVVKDVHEANADALVVVVGVYNPLDGVVLNAGKVSIDLGLLLDILVEATGVYNLAGAILEPNCIFVEAKHVATSLSAGEMSAEELAYTLTKKGEAMLPSAEGAEYIKGQIMNALTVVSGGHVATTVPAVAPTCEENGLTEGTKCAVCGAVLEAQEVVPALGHSWDDGVVKPNGYLKKYVLYTCTVCGATMKESLDKNHMAFMAGYPDGTFRPEANMTRAEVATMFYAMVNEDYKTGEYAYAYSDKFSDIAEGEWYTEPVLQLAKLGVIAGYPDGSFQPNAYITRAEFACMAVGLAQMEIDGTELFPDVAENDWFYDFVRTAVANGCVAGYPDGTFRPNDNIKRCEAAVVACGMLGRNCGAEFFDGMDDVKVLSDVPGHWAYYWLLEATNDHVKE